MIDTKRNRPYSTACLLIILAAFAVRAYHLDYQSFWSDEGISLARSSQPLPELLATMPVEHLPGYFVLLHGWLAATGNQDYAIRFLSLWPSVLAVALLYRLGVDLGNRRAGLMAAGLLTLNAIQVWYAQEARVYSWLLATSLWASVYFWRLFTDRSLRSVPGYALSISLTVYFHYYGFLTPLAHTIFALGWLLLRRDWRAFLRWAGGALIALLLFLPWMRRAMDIFAFNGWREPIDPWSIPWRIFTAYTASDFTPEKWRLPLWWLYAALFLLGIGIWWRKKPTAASFLAVVALAPVLIVFGLALRTPDFHERYTILVSAPLMLTVAGALSFGEPQPGQPHRFYRLVLAGYILSAGIFVLLSAGNVLALQELYHNPALHKPDFRSAAQTILAQEQPGDVIVVDGPDPEIVFLHYYQGTTPVHDLRKLIGASGAEIDQELTAITQSAHRVWELLFFHEPGPVQAWLAAHGWSTPPSDHNGIRLMLYGMAGAPLTEQPQQMAFGPTLILTHSAVSSGNIPRGQPVWVSTYWQVVQPSPDYKFSLRLLNANGEQVEAQDYVPQNWFTPTSTWPVGQIFVDRRGILLPAHLISGNYRITLRLYDPNTGAVVETPAGQDVVLGEVVVE